MAGDLCSIDIQDGLISAVILRQQAGRPVVGGWGVVATDGVLNPQVFVELMGKTGFTGGDCRISFATREIYFNNLSLPFSNRKKIEKVLLYELEDISPVDIESIVVDFILCEETGKKTEVITAMVGLEIMAQRLGSLREAGLDPDIITLSGPELARGLADLPATPSDFLLLDVGLRCATMILVRDGRIDLIRPLGFDFGECQAEFRLGEDLQVIPARPENLPKAYAVLSSSVRQTLLATLGRTTPPPIYLTGSAAKMPELSRCLKDSFAVEIRQSDLLREFSLPSTAAGSEGWVPGIMNQALALAMRPAKYRGGFNFMKGEFRPRRSWKSSDLQRGKARLVLVVAAVLIFCLMGYDFVSKTIEKRRLDSKIKAVLTSTMPGVSRIEDPVGRLQAEIGRVRRSGGLGVGYRILDLLGEISGRIPPSVQVRLTQMNMDENGVRIKGTTDTFNTVDRIKKELEQSPLFHSVTITSANLVG